MSVRGLYNDFDYICIMEKIFVVTYLIDKTQTFYKNMTSMSNALGWNPYSVRNKWSKKSTSFIIFGKYYLIEQKEVL